MDNSFTKVTIVNPSLIRNIWTFILLYSLSAYAKTFDRAQCIKDITKDPTRATFLKKYDPTSIVVDLATCLAICGNETDFSSDAIPRLNAWFLPLIVLLFSLHSSNSGGSKQGLRKQLEALHIGAKSAAHAVGDPLDYVYCMLSRGLAWKECIGDARIVASSFDIQQQYREYDVEVQRIAGILFAFGRIHEHAERMTHGKALQSATAAQFKAFAMDYASLRRKQDSQVDLRNDVGIQSGNVWAAIAAILLYTWQLIGVFVSAIGQAPSPSGGRVAYLLLQSWILDVVLCSNTIGDFSCVDGSAYRLTQFLLAKYPKEDPAVLELLVTESLSSSYSRGRTQSIERRGLWQPRIGLALWSALPVLTAVTFAIGVTALPPTYANIRLVLPMLMGLNYLLIMPCFNRSSDIVERRFKNAVMALINTMVLIMASTGILFGNCRGWWTRAGYVLNDEKAFGDNQEVIFPALVSACIGLQVLYWVGTKLLMLPTIINNRMQAGILRLIEVPRPAMVIHASHTGPDSGQDQDTPSETNNLDVATTESPERLDTIPQLSPITLP